MSNTKEVTINDNLYILHRIDAFQALKLFGDLQKELLPAFGELLAGAMGAGAVENGQEGAQVGAEGLDGAALSKAISSLSSKLSGDQLELWSERLLTKDNVSVELNGKVMPLDKTARTMAFKEFTDILELLGEVIVFNFAGPLKGFLSRFGLDQALLKTAKS